MFFLAFGFGFLIRERTGPDAGRDDTASQPASSASAS
jgi:hypothetical protein